MTEASAPSASIRHLPTLFHALPVETQHAVLSVLSSRDHLYALSLSSRHLNTLSAEHLFRDIWFDPLDSDDSVLSYLLHCAPRHGRLCRSLKLGYSLGPMVSRAADLLRSELFLRVIQHTRTGVRELEIDIAGTDLRNILTLFRGLAETYFPQLQSIHLKIHDVEDDEISTLKKIFKCLASNTANFPALHSVTLEGYWELANSGRTRSAFKAVQNWLAGLPSLHRVNLYYLTISQIDLTALLTGIELTRLSLEEIEPLTWQDCIEAIPPPSRKTLRVLSLGLPDNNISNRCVMAEACLPALGRLDIQIHRYATTGSADANILSLFSSILGATTTTEKKATGSSQLVLPSLQVLGMADAFHQLAGDSRCSLQVLLDTLVHLPTTPIKHVVLTRTTTSLPVSTVQALNEARSYLHSNGIQTHSTAGRSSSIDEDEDDNARYTAYASQRVDYINRDLRNGRVADPEYAAMADAAAEALAKAHGATLL